MARALRLVADAPLDARTLVRRLVAADPAANTYLADLTPAGGGYAGAALVGASPELLVARRGDVVTCRPFAGSAPRSPDPDTDRANGAAPGRIGQEPPRARAGGRCDAQGAGPAVRGPADRAAPELSRTAAVWHLSTPISGRVRETSTTALDLAVALHPTPAVGGVPAAAAAGLINELEGDRGFYAGAVGWCDARWRRPVGGLDPVRAALRRPPHR